MEEVTPIKLALIAPLKHLAWTHTTDYQLLLPDMLLENAAYKWNYEFLRHHHENQFFILDNGIAEGCRFLTKELIEIAQGIGADEIVIPDEPGDEVVTLRELYKWADEVPENIYQWMFVPQGKTMKTWTHCLTTGIDQHGDKFDTIGVPRNLIKYWDNYGARLEAYAVIKREVGDEFDIHFLGMDSRYPFEAYEIISADLKIRGIDTSLPFNWACGGSKLNGTFTKNGFPRPDNYFYREDYPEKAVQDNIVTLRKWLHA